MKVSPVLHLSFASSLISVSLSAPLPKDVVNHSGRRNSESVSSPSEKLNERRQVPKTENRTELSLLKGYEDKELLQRLGLGRTDAEKYYNSHNVKRQDSQAEPAKDSLLSELGIAEDPAEEFYNSHSKRQENGVYTQL